MSASKNALVYTGGIRLEPFEQLGLVAEIAATYSGFIAVFLVFSRNDGKFSPADANFVQAMILSCLSAVVFSLAPGVCSLLLPAHFLWVFSSWLAVVLLACGLSYQAWWQFRASVEVAGDMHYVWHVPGWLIAIASLAAFIASLFASEAASGFYVLGTSLLLGLGVWSFMAIIFRRFI